MPLAAPSLGYVTHHVLSSMTEDMAAATLYGNTSAASRAWTAGANGTIFIPLPILDRPRTYATAFWLNGITIAGNIDVGVYTIAGTVATKVAATAATLQATASVMQTVALAVTLQAGVQYYLAMGASAATSTHWASSGGGGTTTKSLGCYQATTGHPMSGGATITVASGSGMTVPVFGLAELASF